MDINVLDKYVSRFATSLHINQLKLSDLATKKPVKLTDDQILETEEATPDKFETETIRFWRIKKLLPFFEEKKHARISLAQLMWLKFLAELRKLSPSTTIMIKAHDYFIRRAYDNRLGYNNLLAREKEFKEKSILSEEGQMVLNAYEAIISDKNLMYSLDKDINYFNMGILDYVVNDIEVVFVYYYKKVKDPVTNEVAEVPEFNIIRDGEIEVNKEGAEISEKFDFDFSPCVLIPAKHIVYDTFYDCNISENAFNIQILEKSEKSIFKLIKEKKIDKVIFYLGQENKPEEYSLLGTENNYNINGIKETKFKMCTKKYNYGIGLLTNGESIPFNPNPNSIENRENK
jgi:hypothetical protein